MGCCVVSLHPGEDDVRFDCNGFFRPVLRISFSLLEFILSSLCIYPTSYPNPMRQTAARYYLALPFAVSCPGPPPCAPCSSLPAAKSPRCSFLQCIRSRTKTFRPTRSFSRTPSPSFSSPRRRSTAPPSRSSPLQGPRARPMHRPQEGPSRGNWVSMSQKITRSSEEWDCSPLLSTGAPSISGGTGGCP